MVDAKKKIPYEMLLNKKGRARLPDKLMEHLNNKELDEVIWWLPDGNSFAMDSKTVQEKFLDVHFRGTKLTSFIRSLNRWGFRRVFFHAMPRNAICFQSPKFKKDEPQLMRDMKLAAAGAAGSAKASYTPPDRGNSAVVAAAATTAASAAVASASQVGALFGGDLGGARVNSSQQAPFLSPSMAASLRPPPHPLGLEHQARLHSLSLLQESAPLTSNLAQFGALGGALGQPGISRALGLSSSGGFPGLNSQGDRALLLAMTQREELVQQLRQQDLLHQANQTVHAVLQQQEIQRAGSLSARARDLEYVQNLLPSRATSSLLGGVMPQGSLTPRLLNAANRPTREQQDPPVAGEAGRNNDAAELAEYLARRGR